MAITDIQYDLFPVSPSLSPEPETLELKRPHKWAHGETVQLALVAIELVPHEGRWMWATRLNSHNGSGQGSRALPKWNRFAATKSEALLHGVDEVRGFMHRATESEQPRISEWLADLASSATASAPECNCIESSRGSSHPMCTFTAGVEQASISASD